MTEHNNNHNNNNKKSNSNSNRSKSENIRVVARFRPVNKREKKEYLKLGSTKYANEPEVPCSSSGPTVKIANAKTGRPLRFTFDEVLWWKSTQEQVFQTVAAPTCRSALNGFNGTVFAYGQTGSGKTHTMIGPEQKYSVADSGIVPRAASFFFQAIENSADIESCELRVSFLEVYKGRLRDLNPGSRSYPALKIRQKLNNETYVENLNETPVTSLSQVLKYLASANAKRTMASTSMNKTSSRSHLVITFILKLRKTPEAGGHKLTSRVNFIDLAGSEKVKKTGAIGQRLMEAKSINLGLSTLSRVIEALVKKRRSIPFRDSILTWILKDSLAGNTRTTLIVTCSPHIFNKEECVGTCRFAARCRFIKTVVSSNKELTPQQMKALIKKLKLENAKMREEIELGAGMDPNAMSNSEKDELIQQYLLKIRGLQEELEDEKRLRHAAAEELRLKNEEEDKLNIYRQKIEDQGFEIDDLRAALEAANLEKRDLAVMNGILAARMDDHKEEADHASDILDIARANVTYLKEDQTALMEELKDLKFSNEEAQSIYNNVFKEIEELNLALDDREDELRSLRDENNKATENLETKNFELSSLEKQLQMANESGGSGGNNNNNQNGNEDEKYDGGGGGNVQALDFTLKANLEEQEQYLQDLAERDQEVWDEKEENAWRKYLNMRAKKEGFKKAKGLLKHRRQLARQELEAGNIDEMPADEELLEDIRDDFYRLYDPVTGDLREEDDEEKDDTLLNVNELMDINDENAIDDPFEWAEEEVLVWLKSIGLHKYCKIFYQEVVDGRALLIDLTKTNLKRDLKVKSVHIEKILRGIEDLRARSPGYDEFRIDQGLDEEKVVLNRVQIDDEFDVDFDAEAEERNEREWQLTDEEKQFGEQFWQLDELFNILDIYKTGSLDLAAFKHGLHALSVEMNDEEMDNVFVQICGNSSDTRVITYKMFVDYLSFTDLLASQSQKYAQDILNALPKVAGNRRQYATRAAMVIKYAIQYNNTKTEINNYLLNKGLTRAEISAAWKQYRFNPKAIRDIDFKSMIGKKGKLVDMAIKDPENVQAFNDFGLFKLLKRAGYKSLGSKEFNDLIYLRAAGDHCRLRSVRCLFNVNSRYFNGFQVSYECVNGERMKGGRNYQKMGGNYIDEELVFEKGECLVSVTVYFAQFVCGVLYETDKRSRLFGSDDGCTSVVLSAPMGTCIMAFYGSIGRLVETMGVYVSTVDGGRGGGGGNKRPVSGQKKVKRSKSKRNNLMPVKKSKKNRNTNHHSNNDSDDEGYAPMGSMASKSSQSSKNKSRKKGKFEESSTRYEDDY